MKAFFKDFKEFISRGSVLDMAVGVIIGTAFTAIVTSLVNDVIMPLVGVVIGGIDFTSLSITVGGAEVKYGMFIQNVVNFLLIALCIFTATRIVKKLHDKVKGEEIEEPKEEEAKDIVLLREIRDLLAGDYEKALDGEVKTEAEAEAEADAETDAEADAEAEAETEADSE